MAQYIDKSALVAEINKLQLCTMDEHMNYYSAEAQGEYNALSKLESFLDTLKVKEVDLEKEINKYISNNFFGSQTIGFYANRTNEEPNDQDIVLCAKHFFELGMQVSNKAQKGE